MKALIAAAVVCGASLMVGALLMLFGRHRNVLMERVGVEGDDTAIDDGPGLDELTLTLPLSERVLIPLLGGLGKRLEWFAPRAAIDDARRLLLASGTSEAIHPEVILAIQACCALLVGGAAVVVDLLSEGGLGAGIVLGLVGVASGFVLPRFMLERRARARQRRLVRHLLDVVDLLAITVEAGMALQSALERVCSRSHNELTEELNRALNAYKLGLSFPDALTEMADRVQLPALSACVRILVQSNEAGFSIAQSLRIQADQLRLERRVRAQENAQKAPVKMLFPMVGCMFPTIFLILLGPAAIRLLHH